jgi:damage-control phosphatase, subfamily I
MPATIKNQHMISDYRCFFCFTKAFENILENEKLSTEDKKRFTRRMASLYYNSSDGFSAPEYSRSLHKLLIQFTNNRDPHKAGKKQSNDLVLEMYGQLKKQVQQSKDPFDTASRLAIAGNIIDFAISTEYDLHATINHVLHSDLSIDHSVELRQALIKAKTVLYLGDNAGEIVLDKLLIETLAHPNVFYAVRGAPVNNDATLDDAKYIGMDTVAKVLSNGYDAPSTIIEKCSPEFREVYTRADVIISKGQGNLEGLLGSARKEIFFLLMVKCDVIADALKVQKGDFVIKMNKHKM